MVRPKQQTIQCFCSLLGRGAIPHRIRTSSPDRLAAHERQRELDQEERQFSRDMNNIESLGRKIRSETRESLPSNLWIGDDSDSATETAVRSHLVKCNNNSDDSMDEELRCAGDNMRDMETLKKGPAETDSEFDIDYDGADEDSDEGSGNRGGRYDQTLQRTLGLNFEQYVELLAEESELEEDAEGDDDSRFDYQNPYFNASIEQLSSMVYDNIRSKGMSDIQDARLRRFIEVTMAEDEKPRTRRGARKLLEIATFFKGKTYDCCRNSCMSFFSYPKATRCLNEDCKAARYKKGTRTPVATYTVFPLEHRLRLHFSDPIRSKLYVDYRSSAERVRREEGKVTDFWSGSLCADLYTKGCLRTEEPRDLCLQFSTDGTKAFKTRSNFYIWPAIFQILNLPPEMRVRRHNLMMSMVIPGPNQPKNIESFFEPMIQELERLEKGITNVWDGNLREFFTLRVFTPLVAADQPARATEMRFGGASSIMFCSMCTQVGLSYGTKSYFPHVAPINVPATKLSQMENNSLNGRVIFDMSIEPLARFPLRDDGETRKTAKRIKLMRNGAAKDNLKYNTGIKCVSQWARLKAIDMRKSFNICGMHLLYENVMPKLTKQYRGVFKYGTNPIPGNDSSRKEAEKKVEDILFRYKSFSQAPLLVPAVSRLRGSESTHSKIKVPPPTITTPTTQSKPVRPNRFQGAKTRNTRVSEMADLPGTQGDHSSASTPTRSLSSFSKESSVIYLRKEGMDSTAETGTGIEDSDEISTRHNTPTQANTTTKIRKRPVVMWMSRPRPGDQGGGIDDEACSETNELLHRQPVDRKTMTGGGRTSKRVDHKTTKAQTTRESSRKRKRMDDRDTRDLIAGLELPDDIKRVLFDGIGKKTGKDDVDASSGISSYSTDRMSDSPANDVSDKPDWKEESALGAVDAQDMDDQMVNHAGERVIIGEDDEPLLTMGTSERSIDGHELSEDFVCVQTDMDSSDDSNQNHKAKTGVVGSRKRRAPNRFNPCEPTTKKSRSSIDSSFLREPPPKKTRRKNKKEPNCKNTGTERSKKEKNPNNKLPKFNYVPEDGYNVPPDDWKDIGKDSVISNTTFPAQFGDNMKDFTTHCHRLKAANWSRWAYSESLVHLFDRLKEPHYGEYVNFIRAMMLSVQYELTLDEIAEIRRRMDRFVMYYEANMYRFDYYRIQACLSVIHYLRHIADCIEWAGPLYVYWQYCTERLCGMITSAIRSRKDTNTNIKNIQEHLEQTHLLPFVIKNSTTLPSKGGFDGDGHLLLEEVLAKSIKLARKADDILNQSSVELSMSDSDSDNPDQPLGPHEQKTTPPRKTHLDITGSHRFAGSLRPNHKTKKHELTPAQQAILRDYLSVWYRLRTTDMPVHEKDPATGDIGFLSSGHHVWKFINKNATKWRALEITTTTNVCGFTTSSRMERVNGLSFRPSEQGDQSSRSSSLAEVGPANAGELVASSRGRLYVETFFFVSVDVPIRYDTTNDRFVTDVLHLAFVKPFPTTNFLVLLEAHRRQTKRRFEFVEANRVVGLVGLIHTRSREFVVWKKGCICLESLEIYEKQWQNGNGSHVSYETIKPTPANYTDTQDTTTDLFSASTDKDDDTYNYTTSDLCASTFNKIGKKAKQDGFSNITTRSKTDTKIKHQSRPSIAPRGALGHFFPYYIDVEVPADGHCGYHAVAEGLTRAGIHKSQMQVRHDCATQFLKYPERYMRLLNQQERLIGKSALLGDILGIRDNRPKNIWFSCPMHSTLVSDFYKIFVGVIDGYTSSFMTVFSPGHLDPATARQFEWRNKHLRSLMERKRGADNVVSIEHGVSDS